MAYWLDYRNIDDARRPGSGPVHQYLIFNKIKPDGVCHDIAELNGDYAVRRRVYELRDGANNLTANIITHTDFIEDQFKAEYISRLLLITCVSYSFLLHLTPEQIIFPAGLYSVACERRAVQGFFRAKTKEELARSPDLVRRMGDYVRRERPQSLNSMYCFDSAKLGRFYEEIEHILLTRKVRNRFGMCFDLPTLLTPKVLALLEQTLYEEKTSAQS